MNRAFTKIRHVLAPPALGLPAAPLRAARASPRAGPRPATGAARKIKQPPGRGPRSEREAELKALVGVEHEDGHGGGAEEGVGGAGGAGALALELGGEAGLRGEEREAHERRREVRRLHDRLVLPARRGRG